MAKYIFDLGEAEYDDETQEAIFKRIIRCKDCDKHNKGIDDVQYKTDACPLVAFRGKAISYEFDYQDCAYGRKIQ